MLAAILFAATVAQLNLEAFRQRVIELAPAGAYDCDRDGMDRLEQCATDHLARKAPFFCIGGGAPFTSDVISMSMPFAHAFIGDGNGRLDLVSINSSKRLTRVAILGPNVKSPPLRIGGFVQPPQIVRQVREKVKADGIDGIVILETIVDVTGAIRESRVLKPLPKNLDKVADQLLRQAVIRPGMLFGQPYPVIFNFTAKVENGEMTVPVIYRGTGLAHSPL